MVGGSIPGKAATGTLAQQVLEKGNRSLGIAGFRRLNQTLLSVNIHCPIVSLFATFIADGKLDALSGFAPHIPTQVSPQQMAFILEDNGQLS